MGEYPTSKFPVPLLADYAPTVHQAVSLRRIVVPISVAIFLIMLPVTMLVPVLKQVVADRFAVSTFWTHSFMSINMMGAIVAAPLGGILADRMGRRKSILAGALLCDAILLWALGNATSFPLFMALRLCEGMSHILALTALMAIASDWAPSGGRGRMMGVIGAAMMFGTTVGSPLGGAIGRAAPLLVFPIGALIALAAGLLVVFFVRETDDCKNGITFRDIRDLVRSHRALAVPFAYAFIDRLCVGVIISTFVLYLSNSLLLAPHQIGMMMACFMLPFAALTYPAGRLIDRFGRVWPMALGSIAFGMVFATYGLWSPGQLIVVMVISGVLSAAMFAPNLALCADLTPKGFTATAFAGFNVAGSLGFLCGPLLGGTLCTVLLAASGDESGYRITLGLAGATEVLCALITLPMLLRLRRKGLIT
ncbi:MAG: MFS transporter [Planctomycetes bacterium]|nr:MFS transporter [Planctomycetota bacterium]